MGCGCPAIVAIVIVSAGTRRQEQVSDVLRVRRLEIVNEKGAPVVCLDKDEMGNGFIAAGNADGTPKAIMHVMDTGGGALQIRAKNESMAVGVYTNEYGHGAVGVFNARGKLNVGLMAGDEGGGISLHDDAGAKKFVGCD